MVMNMKNLLVLGAAFSAAPVVTADRSLSGIFTPPVGAPNGANAAAKAAESPAALPAASLVQESSVDEDTGPYIPEDKNNMDFLGEEPQFLADDKEMTDMRSLMMTTKIGDPFYGLHSRDISGSSPLSGDDPHSRDISGSSPLSGDDPFAGGKIVPEPRRPSKNHGLHANRPNGAPLPKDKMPVYHMGSNSNTGLDYKETRDVAGNRLDSMDNLKKNVQEAIDKSRKAAAAAEKYGKQAGDMLKQNEVNRENLQFFAEDIERQHAGKVEEIRHVLAGGHSAASKVPDSRSDENDVTGSKERRERRDEEVISFMQPQDNEAAEAADSAGGDDQAETTE